MLIPRGLDSSAPPPDPRTKLQNNPTLLFSWWCTGCAVTIVLFRLSGRKIRNGRLFREDKIMALSLIPLLIRMALIHPVLLWGNNNVVTTGLSAEAIYQRSIGSRLVLGARIFYALFIWIAKFTVSEYLKRLFTSFWTSRYEMALRVIRVFLVLSFIAVVISTLAECHPFDHYWQVVPDPGPQCRQAYAQLLTMGVADIITDILLITFPLPMVWRSHFQLKTKIRLVLLFALSGILIVITAYRVPSVISHHSLQQYRSVWASGEILAAAAVSNAIVLGSFLRDRGVKKGKYKADRQASATDSMSAPSTRRQTIAQQTLGSDDDLFDGMCYRTEHEDEESAVPRAPPMADPSPSHPTDMTALRDPKWNFTESLADSNRESEESAIPPHRTLAIDPMPSPRTNDGQPRERRVSFFDVGGLLGEDGSSHSSTLVPSPSNSTTNNPHDAPSTRRPSRPFLSDLGNLLSPGGRNSGSRSASSDDATNANAIELSRPRSSADPPRSILRRPSQQPPPQPQPLPPPSAASPDEFELDFHDVGGLLTPPPELPEPVSSRASPNSPLPNGNSTSGTGAATTTAATATAATTTADAPAPLLSLSLPSPLPSPNFSHPRPHAPRTSSTSG